MFKALAASVVILLVGAGTAVAQQGATQLGGAVPNNAYADNRQFTAAQGNPGSTNQATSDVTMTENNNNEYFLVQPPSNTTTGATTQQSSVVLPTTSSMPYPGTYYAPGNISGMWWGGPNLPVTNMDSFVAESGYNFDIYGDEGVWGPPPLNGFDFPNTIEQGIEESPDNGTLTTGHRAALPSAWLWTTQP